MLTIYVCFLAGGAVLPFLNVIVGALGGGSEIDTDPGLDIGTDLDAEIDLSADIDLDMDIDPAADIDPTTGTADPTAEIPGFTIGQTLAIGLLPTSLMSLSALAIAFGAVGAVMTLLGSGKIISFVVAAITGYIAGVIVQTIIKTLKRLQKRSYGINENELLMYDGKVVDTILPGQLGTVSFHTLKEVHVSYPARCADTQIRLEPGRLVRALEVKNGIFTVEPKNKYE
jgi:hypothetical protein